MIFETESPGCRNPLGSYAVDEVGRISSVQFHLPNVSIAGSGGDLITGDSSEKFVDANTQIGFFVVASGYSYDHQY